MYQDLIDILQVVVPTWLSGRAPDAPEVAQPNGLARCAFFHAALGFFAPRRSMELCGGELGPIDAGALRILRI